MENMWKDIDAYLKYPYDQNNCAFFKNFVRCINV